MTIKKRAKSKKRSAKKRVKSSKKSSKKAKPKRAKAKKVKAKRSASKSAVKKRTTHIESIILHATKINPVYFGISFGVAFGIATVLIGWLGAMANCCASFINMASSVFYGYAANFAGGLLGGVWAFVIFTLIGMVLAYTYNQLHQ